MVILSAGDEDAGGAFDATTVHPYTAYFGPSGWEARMDYFSYADVDGDGDQDLALMFNRSDAGYDCNQSCKAWPAF